MEKWVIFDFDGTLVDTLQVGVAILNSLADKFGFKKIGPEDHERLRSKLPRQMLKEVGISLWKLPAVAREVRNQVMLQSEKFLLYSGIKEALQRLSNQNIKLAILTTGSLENAQKILKRNEIDNLFEFVHSEDNLFGKGKIIKKLLKQYQINANTAVYVGDEVRDVRAAKDAGLRAAAVTWGVNSKEILEKQNPDFIFDRPEQLADL